MSRLCRAFSPIRDTTTFRYFRTNLYKFNMFETANGLRFVLFSSLRDDSVDFQVVFGQLFQHYIDYVKRNFLYEQDDYIEVPKFKDVTNGLFADIAAKRKK